MAESGCRAAILGCEPDPFAAYADAAIPPANASCAPGELDRGHVVLASPPFQSNQTTPLICGKFAGIWINMSVIQAAFEPPCSEDAVSPMMIGF